MITTIQICAILLGSLFAYFAPTAATAGVPLVVAALSAFSLAAPNSDATKNRLIAATIAGFFILFVTPYFAGPLPAFLAFISGAAWLCLLALKREVDTRGNEETQPIVEQLANSDSILAKKRDELAEKERAFRIQAERHEAVRAFGSSLRFEEAWHDIERGAKLLLHADPIALFPPLCQGLPEGIYPRSVGDIDAGSREFKAALEGRRVEQDEVEGGRAFWIPVNLGDQNRVVMHFRVDPDKILPDAIGIFTVQTGLLLEKIRLYSEVELQSRTDLMTGLPHQAGFKHHLGDEFARAQRTGRPLTLLMADVDHFKSVNDTYGHLVGDQVLMHVARKIKETVRISDLPCRYGGEEFAVILVETPLEGAREISERIRVAVESHAMLIRGDTGEELLRKTISVGVATWPLDGIETAEQLLECADKALYQAKRGGRNKVVHFGV